MIKESHIREGAAAAVTRQDIRALVKALYAVRAIANAVTPRAAGKVGTAAPDVFVQHF